MNLRKIRQGIQDSSTWRPAPRLSLAPDAWDAAESIALEHGKCLF